MGFKEICSKVIINKRFRKFVKAIISQARKGVKDPVGPTAFTKIYMLYIIVRYMSKTLETASLANGPARLATATLANGCFWCTEAIFKRLKGVESVISGYTGGQRENPSYEQVSTGVTGHAEALQIEFDPNVISYETVLDVFFATHDPTELNRQGNDVGTQYRSAIFYDSPEQKEIAERKIRELSGSYESPIVTEVTPFAKFYPAEEHHQDYYDQNRNVNMYCKIVIDPKVKKLLTKFNDKVKEEYK